MANIGRGAYASMLDWSLKTSSIATPANLFVGLSLGSPTTVSFSEVGTGSGYARQSMAFAAAAVPASSASASNSTAASFGTFSSSAVISGIFLADSVSNAAGSMLWYGLVATLRTPLPGDQVVLNAGQLAITLS
jgi:hypothetical protein